MLVPASYAVPFVDEMSWAALMFRSRDEGMFSPVSDTAMWMLSPFVSAFIIMMPSWKQNFIALEI
jgi:hypothetical protein